MVQLVEQNSETSNIALFSSFPHFDAQARELRGTYQVISQHVMEDPEVRCCGITYEGPSS